MILVDSNVLLDVLQDDPNWAAWSQAQLESAALIDRLAITDEARAQIYSGNALALLKMQA